MASPAALPKEPSLITSGLIAVSVVFPVLSALAILFRFKARRIGQQPTQSDDWWILATWILTLGESILVWVFAPMIGTNSIKVSLMEQGQIAMEHWMLLALFIAAGYIQLPLAAVKISILFFYKRIFSVRSFRIAAWLLIILCGVWGIVFFLVIWFQCDPYNSCWDPPVILRYDSYTLGLAQVGSSIALDVIILCTPIPIILRLKMNTTRKFAVASIFWLGGFCCVAAIVRLILIKISVNEVIHQNNSIPIESKNFIFIIIEPNCSIIAACMPTYGPLFAGGRGLGSVIRSVRSMLSLRSISSSHSRSRARSTDDVVGKTNASTDSHVELHPTPKSWNETHGNQSHTANVTYDRDEEVGPYGKDGINVTTAYDISRN